MNTLHERQALLGNRNGVPSQGSDWQLNFGRGRRAPEPDVGFAAWVIGVLSSGQWTISTHPPNLELTSLLRAAEMPIG